MRSSAPKRMHPSGRLTFRHKVRPARTAELPCFEARDGSVPWSELVPAGVETVEIEIGPGKGTFLIEAATRRPAVFFVGVEASPAYARYCADRLVRRGLENAVLLVDDARLFLQDTVPEGVVTRLHVYFPDPWPKRRHRKRRLFGPEFPPLVHRGLTASGELLIATDDCRYFGETLAVLGESPLLRRARELEERYDEEVSGLAFGPTNFSRRYQEEGRRLFRAVYVNEHAARQTPRE